MSVNDNFWTWKVSCVKSSCFHLRNPAFCFVIFLLSHLAHSPFVKKIIFLFYLNSTLIIYYIDFGLMGVCLLFVVNYSYCYWVYHNVCIYLLLFICLNKTLNIKRICLKLSFIAIALWLSNDCYWFIRTTQ